MKEPKPYIRPLDKGWVVAAGTMFSPPCDKPFTFVVGRMDGVHVPKGVEDPVWRDFSFQAICVCATKADAERIAGLLNRDDQAEP